jgi:acyl-CoA reductase-like NAD-dependent aldehyde dehydrogenase
VPYRSANPATGEVLKIFTEHTDQEMMDALATADKACVLGSSPNRRTRKDHFTRRPASARTEERLAKVATLEMGTLEEKAGMLEQLWTMFQSLTGIATDQLALSLQEIPSSTQWKWARSCKRSDTNRCCSN